MALKTNPFNPAKYLDNDEAVAAYEDAIRREALEEAAKVCDRMWSAEPYDPEKSTEEQAFAACAHAIRALLTDEHSPEQAGGNPAGETDREPVGPGDVQRSENEADERGEQE